MGVVFESTPVPFFKVFFKAGKKMGGKKWESWLYLLPPIFLPTLPRSFRTWGNFLKGQVSFMI